MSLWGKSESLLAGSGTVVINLSTKAVTGTNSTFLDTMVGKVITVGAAGTCGEAVIASRSSATAISVASTQFLVPDGSGNITGVAYTVTEKPISTLGDINYGVTEIYGVDVTEAQTINSGSSKTAEQKKYSPAHAGWVGCGRRESRADGVADHWRVQVLVPRWMLFTTRGAYCRRV